MRTKKRITVIAILLHTLILKRLLSGDVVRGKLNKITKQNVRFWRHVTLKRHVVNMAG